MSAAAFVVGTDSCCRNVVRVLFGAKCSQVLTVLAHEEVAMTKWLRRIRGAVGMGLTWAVGWAIIGGGIMEGIVDPHGKILDMWPQTLAIPGFLLGVVFSVVLSIAERRRRFDELSFPRFAGLGAVAGVALGSLAIAAGAFPGVPLLLRAAGIIGPLTALSAVSAAGSLALARMAEDRGLLRANGDEPDEGLPAREPRKRLADRA